MQYDEKKLEELEECVKDITTQYVSSLWGQGWRDAFVSLLTHLQACRKAAPPPDPDGVEKLAKELCDYDGYHTDAVWEDIELITQDHYRKMARYILEHYQERRETEWEQVEIYGVYLPEPDKIPKRYMCGSCGMVSERRFRYCPACGARGVDKRR